MRRRLSGVAPMRDMATPQSRPCRLQRPRPKGRTLGGMLAHIAGVPVEESLMYLAPVILVVGWMYFAGRRERRHGGSQGHEDEPATSLDAPSAGREDCAPTAAGEVVRGGRAT
jgi:hypothetical protein